jgi:hypothetical protein
MPCRIGHQEGDPLEVNSMSRRDILGITGVSALTLATGAAASLLVASCAKQSGSDTPGTTHDSGDTTANKHEAGDTTVKKHEPRPRAEQYVPCLGAIAIFPWDIQTFDDADKRLIEEDQGKKKEKKRFYLPYYSEYLGKERIERGTKLTCRVLLIGEPPVAAMAVNVSTEQFPEIDHDKSPKTAKEVDNILTALGYGRIYPKGNVLADFITNEECDKKLAGKKSNKP